MLRARRNEKEMKEKPTTTFKIIHNFIYNKKKKKKKKKNKTMCKTEKYKETIPFKFMSQSPSEIFHKNF